MIDEKKVTPEDILGREFNFKDPESGDKWSKRLTDKQRLQVVASYVETGMLKKTARQYGLTPHAVRYIVDGSPEFAAMYQKKREEEANELFAHMSGKYKDVMKFIDNYMDQLVKPEMMERMAKTNMVGATVILGTLLDKMAMVNKFAIDRGDNGDSTLSIEIIRKNKDNGEDDLLEEE